MIDVSVPGTPSMVGEYNHTFLGGIQGGFVDEKYVYAVDPDYGVYILNVSNPTTISVEGIVEEYLISELYVQDSIAYIVSPENGLAIWDITDVSEPLKLGGYSSILKILFRGLAIEGNIAYLGSGDGLLILDISNMEEPSLIYELEDQPVQLVELVGDGIIAYSTGNDGVQLIHVDIILSSNRIPGYSIGIIVLTFLGISTILGYRKLKK
jgi:hypothetical protein